MTDFDHAETAEASDESRASRADFARKVVGDGSVGTEAFMVLAVLALISLLALLFTRGLPTVQPGTDAEPNAPPQPAPVTA